MKNLLFQLCLYIKSDLINPKHEMKIESFFNHKNY